MAQEADLFLVFFADVWPPPEPAHLAIGPTPVGDMAFRMSTTGSIGVVLRTEAGEEQLLFDGQPVNFTGRAAMLLNATVTEAGVTLRVNGTPLLSVAECSDVLELESAEIAVSADPPSIAHAEASEVCAAAVQRRAAWLADPARIPVKWTEGARAVTDEEQREQLAEAVESLRALGAAVASGHGHFTGPLASLLRALLYVQQGRPSYNPLLLRLAGREMRPLPVYAFDEPSADGPAVLQEASMHIIPNAPTITRMYPGQRLMDLQDWMDRPIRIERAETAGGAEPVAMTLAAGSVIAEAANKFGAHYDEWVPHALDHLRSLGIDRSMFVRFLLAVSETTCALGDWLLGRDLAAVTVQDP